MYRSSFLDAATWTFKWPIVEVFWNKDESLDGIAPSFKYDR